MKRSTLAKALIYTIALALLIWACAGCAMFQPCPVDPEAERFVTDYRSARTDGEIDAGEVRMLDSDAGYVEQALEEKQTQAFPIPSTGIPWLDIALGVAGLAATGVTTHKVTMRKRDKTRAEVLKK